MKTPASVERRTKSGEITAPWPSIGRLRTPKPRLIVALERLPSSRSYAALERELQVFDPEARFSAPPSSPPGTRARIRLGGQVTEIYGSPVRFDIDEVLPLAQWSEQEKTRLADHEAYVMCTPNTSVANAYEQYQTLYRIAMAYGQVGGLCGVVNPLALSFTPPVAVENLLSDEMVAQCRRRLPPQLYTSFAQYFSTDGTWCSTRGQEVFGVPNFAFLSVDRRVEVVFDELWSLFLYGYEEGGVYSPGSDVLFGGGEVVMKMRRVSEVAPGWEPYLETAGGTLVISPE